MKTALDLRSKSGIHRLVSALEERGFIARRHHRARALEVAAHARRIRRCSGAEPPRNESSFAPNVIRGNFAGRLTGARAAAEAVAVQLPLYGRIAAGVPIEALRRHDAAHRRARRHDRQRRAFRP
jgi:repressor LexA